MLFRRGFGTVDEFGRHVGSMRSMTGGCWPCKAVEPLLPGCREENGTSDQVGNPNPVSLKNRARHALKSLRYVKRKVAALYEPAIVLR